MALANLVLTSSAQTVFSSSPTGNQEGHAVTTMIICNTGLTPAQFSVYAVPAGQTASTSNQIVNALVVPGGDTVSLDQEKLVLGAGDSIVATSNFPNTLTMTISVMPI